MLEIKQFLGLDKKQMALIFSLFFTCIFEISLVLCFYRYLFI